ncbi:MAG: response regulator transcription factor [Anaerolineae bacterium]
MLVDDQAVVRDGLRSMLSLEPDVRVVGEAEDGGQAIRRLPALLPDVVLMDVRMPGMDGLTALREVKRIAPRVSVIMVTLYDDPSYLLQAVMDGAAGYVLKDAGREDLVRAVRVTAEGGALVAPSMLPHLLRRIAETAEPKAAQAGKTANLSERELEVLRLVAEGLTNQEIAQALIVSPTTIKSHVQNIIVKLGVSDRTQAAVQGVRQGLI